MFVPATLIRATVAFGLLTVIASSGCDSSRAAPRPRAADGRDSAPLAAQSMAAAPTPVRSTPDAVGAAERPVPKPPLDDGAVTEPPLSSQMPNSQGRYLAPNDLPPRYQPCKSDKDCTMTSYRSGHCCLPTCKHRTPLPATRTWTQTAQALFERVCKPHADTYEHNCQYGRCLKTAIARAVCRQGECGAVYEPTDL